MAIAEIFGTSLHSGFFELSGALLILPRKPSYLPLFQKVRELAVSILQLQERQDPEFLSTEQIVAIDQKLVSMLSDKKLKDYMRTALFFLTHLKGWRTPAVGSLREAVYVVAIEAEAAILESDGVLPPTIIPASNEACVRGYSVSVVVQEDTEEVVTQQDEGMSEGASLISTIQQVEERIGNMFLQICGVLRFLPREGCYLPLLQTIDQLAANCLKARPFDLGSWKERAPEKIVDFPNENVRPLFVHCLNALEAEADFTKRTAFSAHRETKRMIQELAETAACEVYGTMTKRGSPLGRGVDRRLFSMEAARSVEKIIPLNRFRVHQIIEHR